MAYILVVASLLHFIDVARAPSGQSTRMGAGLLLATITVQAGIGILTLLYQTPILLGLLHQGMALVVLTIAVMHAQRLQARPSAALAGARV
jgi:heme a synthase